MEIPELSKASRERLAQVLSESASLLIQAATNLLNDAEDAGRDHAAPRVCEGGFDGPAPVSMISLTLSSIIFCVAAEWLAPRW